MLAALTAKPQVPTTPLVGNIQNGVAVAGSGAVAALPGASASPADSSAADSPEAGGCSVAAVGSNDSQGLGLWALGAALLGLRARRRSKRT